METLTPEIQQEILRQLAFLANYWWLILIVTIWTIPWKGLALWKSVKNESKPWFIVFLLVNTLGILEILYIYWLGKKKTLMEKIVEKF